MQKKGGGVSMHPQCHTSLCQIMVNFLAELMNFYSSSSTVSYAWTSTRPPLDGVIRTNFNSSSSTVSCRLRPIPTMQLWRCTWIDTCLTTSVVQSTIAQYRDCHKLKAEERPGLQPRTNTHTGALILMFLCSSSKCQIMSSVISWNHWSRAICSL